ncbi:MAG TPA: 2-C-methyl-D-erythritol 4-phosphate cytidylyltransferase, partial [Sphingomonas sp.]|uniref:2-C-methyl-D-erythritol 4-phosphate cytidylyltransferase n=1 Tax=Sphingomonas sp. TaxID=28214 RepID=UPI002EDAD955
MTHIVAIIVAAGTGSRAGGALPKQFAMLAGRPMLVHAYDALRRHPAVAETLVVTDVSAAGDVLPGARLVEGGATRRASVAAGLRAAADLGASHVLIH